jgi:hypothetical protein
MSQVVTELVIDSNTSGADQFSQAMDKAGSSAEKGSSSVAGLRAFIDYVGNTNKQLVDIADNAAAAGLSTREFRATAFCRPCVGPDRKGFCFRPRQDRRGSDRGQPRRYRFRPAVRAERAFDQAANGDIKTAGQALGDVMGLMQNATPAVQRGIAQIVGVSKDWIPFLRQGSDEFERQKQAAAGLGVIVDDGVIQKAREFNSEWRIAVAAWDLQFKASLAGILPALVQLANIATSVLDKAGQLGSFFSRSLTPVDQQSSGDLQKDLAALQEYRDKIANVNGEMSEFERFRLENKAGAGGHHRRRHDAALNRRRR